MARRRRRLASLLVKFDDANSINHGERWEPSARSSTAAARAPRRVADSQHALYELRQLIDGAQGSSILFASYSTSFMYTTQ